MSQALWYVEGGFAAPLVPSTGSATEALIDTYATIKLCLPQESADLRICLMPEVSVILTQIEALAIRLAASRIQPGANLTDLFRSIR